MRYTPDKDELPLSIAQNSTFKGNSRIVLGVISTDRRGERYALCII